MTDNYIPLQYDRSHLELHKPHPQYGVFMDYFDLTLLVINLIALTAIFFYCFTTSKRPKQTISISAGSERTNEIPFFVFQRQGKKTKSKEFKQQKEKEYNNPYLHFTGYSQVELKCLKCSYSTEVPELKPHSENQV